MTAVTLISWKVTLCDYHHFNNRNFMPVSENKSACNRARHPSARHFGAAKSAAAHRVEVRAATDDVASLVEIHVEKVVVTGF